MIIVISSSLSTSLNSMSAVVLEDFYKPFYKKTLTERQASWLMRGVVILLGTLCVGKYFAHDFGIYFAVCMYIKGISFVLS